MPRIPLLTELFGEPRRPLESFARAVGPAELVPLSSRIGPRGVPSTVPTSPPPHHPLPRSAPVTNPGRSAPPAGRVPGGSGNR